MDLSPQITALLGPVVVDVVANLGDRELRGRVVRSAEAIATVLDAFNGMQLEQYEMSELDVPDPQLWGQAAPSVGRALSAVTQALAHIDDLFGAGAAQEASQAVDVSALQGSSPPRDKQHLEIDRLVNEVSKSPEALGTSISCIAAMLRSNVVRCGARLRNPQVTFHRWLLLEELQDLRAKCIKGVEAMLVAILESVTAHPVEGLLPRYTHEGKQAARLRSAVTWLAFDVAHCNERLRAGAVEPEAVWHYLSRRFEKFASHPVYKYVRAQDKRQLILFQHFLRKWPAEGANRDALAAQVEDLTRFLELMRGINLRAELTTHDRRHLEAARALIAAGLDLEVIQMHLDEVFGRDPELDLWIRGHGHRLGSPPPTLLALVEGALRSLG